MKSCCQFFIPLSIATDVLMMFLSEGVKILFRFTYAVLKTNKKFIKKCNNPVELLGKLKENSRNQINLEGF